MSKLKILFAYILSVVITFMLASIFHTQTVLQELINIGVRIDFPTRISSTLRDMAGLSTLYLLVISITLLLGFSTAALLKRALKPLAHIAYPLAGFTSMGAMLWLMHLNFGSTPIAGARDEIGFFLQMLAGCIGGMAFTRLSKLKIDTT